MGMLCEYDDELQRNRETAMKELARVIEAEVEARRRKDRATGDTVESPRGPGEK